MELYSQFSGHPYWTAETGAGWTRPSPSHFQYKNQNTVAQFSRNNPLCRSSCLNVLMRLPLCLSRDSAPDSLRRAIAKPLLQTASFDPKFLRNFEPVSYLPFVAKLSRGQNGPFSAAWTSRMQQFGTPFSVRVSTTAEYRDNSASCL